MEDVIFEKYKKLQTDSNKSKGLAKKVNNLRLKIYVDEHSCYLLQRSVNLSMSEYRSVCSLADSASKSRLVKVFSKRRKFLK